MTNTAWAYASATPLAVLALALIGASAPSRPGPEVVVEPHPSEKRVDVRVGGKPFTAYIWPDRLMKPVLFPIRTASGTIVTRGFPLDPRPGERADHPHHVGLWLNYESVNGVDFWNHSEAVSPERAAHMGTIRHREVRAATGGDRGRLEVSADWLMPDGHRALAETTTFVFRGDRTSRAIDRLTTLTADERVVFADIKDGFIGMRVARSLEAPSTEPLVFTDASGQATSVPQMDNDGVTGVYHSSEGLEGDAVWGTRARWVALAGRVEGEDVVLVLIDHPKNPGYPTYWHARGYGLFAANPLGQKVFSEGREHLDLTLRAGESTTFRYRLAILPGPYSKEAAEAACTAFVREYSN